MQLRLTKRTAPAVLVGLVAYGTLLLLVAGASKAQVPVATRIAFLSPSSFAASDSGIVVTDTAPNNPSNGSSSYQLTAWAQSAPAGAIVEFEIEQVSALPGDVEVSSTVEGSPVAGGDTFDGHWDIDESWPEGEYLIEAIVYTSQGEALAVARQTVVLQRTAPRVQITYPERADGARPPWGTFLPLRSSSGGERLPFGDVEVTYTDAERGAFPTMIQVWYTTSPPGTAPAWKECGVERIVEGEAVADGVRCKLLSTVDQNNVSAVAAVANSSPGEFNEAFNGAGEALRVRSYAQTPMSLEFVEGDGEAVDEVAADQYPCHTVEVEVVDQLGEEILGANVDIHAWGPGDGLRFDTGVSPPSPVWAPDRGSHATSVGWDCSVMNDQTAMPQGTHAQTGVGDDLKHVEAGPSGTDDSGRWAFNLFPNSEDVSGSQYTTQIVAWIDEQNVTLAMNNDALDAGELAVCGSVGFGNGPEEPVGQPVVALENCTGKAPVQPTPTVSITPTTSPSVAPTPTVAARALSLRAGTARNGQVVLKGRIRSDSAACAAAQDVGLQKKKRKGGFRRVAVGTTTQKGYYRFVREARAASYRTSLPLTSSCAGARSKIVSTQR